MKKTAILSILFIAVITLTASGAFAELCKNCKGKMYIMSIGKCTKCNGHTSSGAFKLCKKCSQKKRVCENCGKPLGGGAKMSVPGKAGSISEGNNNFALELYTRLAVKPGNVFFSPSSIHTALAMTSVGARGTTESQMNSVLHIAPSSHDAYKRLLERLKPGDGYQLNVANALWGQHGFPWQKDFLSSTKANYGAGLKEVDFAKATEKARREINSWVEKQTKDKIKDLLQPGILNSLTRLVLTNAIYFKGDWVRQFDKRATKDAPFTPFMKKPKKVPMMYTKARFMYCRDQGFQVLSMPYKGKELSMVVLLPSDPNSLPELEKSFSMRRLNSLTAKLRSSEVRVFLPKFKLTCMFSLKDHLMALGMKDAFTDASNFSGMNGKRDLYITAVVHKAFVDVNEEGTEAAAATAVVVGLRSARPRPTPVFRADHPFIFMIRHDKTGAILFMGRVADPSE